MDTRPSAFAPPPYRHWLSWAGLLLILYLAVGLVGFRRALITTEIWALYYAGQPWTELWQAIRYDMVHPPLIYLLERGWMHLFGQTDSAVKALALVINIPTLILFPWLASRVTRHWRLASFLFAGTYLSVGSTPNQMRMYGLGLLLAVTAMLLWEWWRKEPGAGKLIAWAFVMLLLVYTHFFGLLLLAAFFAVNWLFGPRRRQFAAATFAIGVAYLPWLAYVLPVYLRDGLRTKVPWVNVFPHRALSQLPSAFLGYLYGPELRVIPWMAALLVHLALFLLAWRTVRKFWPPSRDLKESGRWFWTAALLAGVPILLLYGFAVLVTPVFNARFVLGILPAYWLLVVLLGDFGGRAGRAILYAVVLPWVLVSVGVTMAQSLQPSPARQATTFLNREYRDTDLILCDGHGLAHPRRFGLACHLGVLLDVPTIGVAKSRLVGTHGPVPEARGAWVPLRDGAETIGAVLRTRAGARPVYVSVGHRVSLETAIETVLRCAPRYRLPEPVRRAHALASG